MRKDIKVFFKIIIILSLMSIILLPYVISIAMENKTKENNDNIFYEEENSTDSVSANVIEENTTISNEADELFDKINTVEDKTIDSDTNEDKEFNKTTNSILEDLENDNNISIISALTSYGSNLLSLSTSASNGDVEAKISEALITKTATGVGPFDTESTTDSSNSDGTVTWTAGDDTSANNNIVRSFDQVTWTIENTFTLKDTATVENYCGGILEIEASVPSNLANLVEWDLDSMIWAENPSVSSDGRTFTAQYSMSETEITIPGKQSLVFVLKVLGATNGTEITPTFTLNLLGNDENDKIKVIADTVYVSAAPRYNIKLVRNTLLSDKVTVDYDGEEITGRVYGYGITLQLYNQDSSKGLKGIEYPQGDITFDINLKLERTLEGSSATEDITNVCTPLLWNYKINQNTNTGNITGRTMLFNSYSSSYAYLAAPWGILQTDRKASVYNSGNIIMIQNGNVINTSISGYEFDDIFPIYYCDYNDGNSIIYKNNVGCFSAGYFQILVPLNEESSLEDRSYYLTVNDSNFKATSSSGAKTTSQMVSNDDSDKVQHVIYKSGAFSHHIYLYDLSGTRMQSNLNEGDSVVTQGQKFYANSYFSVAQTNEPDDYIYTVDRLFKFDGQAMEPTQISRNYYNVSKYAAKTMQFKMWFVTKKDGTNWISQTEMNNAQIEDLVMYENLDDIPEGHICIGEYFESISGYLPPMTAYNQYYFAIALNIKDTAIIGQTYGMTQTSRYWRVNLDRTVYSQSIINGYNEYPKPTYSVLNRQYIKTEYDENGKIISGTHYNGYGWGQTVLIVGGNLSVTKKSIDDSGNEKINYDFSKNEYNVTYKITPNLTTTSTITGVTLKITDTLPVGLTYVAGSSDYGEPEITYNSDGTTTLVWYMYGVTTDKAIDTITYQAHLDEMSENGTQYETTVVIAEVPDEDENGNKTYKIGNTCRTNSYTTAVNIINLSSYSLYKTTETPVIEVNGIIHYKITAINKTDDTLTDFQLLDILPYNGDGRGTDYNGTYTVEKIDITQSNTSTGNEVSNNLNFYITDSENVREGISVKDENLGTTDIWSTETSGANINRILTAYALTGELEARAKLEVDIYLKTDGNEPYDLYKNSATAQTNKNTEKIETSIITVQDVKRELSGYVWRDINGDGVITEGEEYLSGVTVTILNEDGSIAYDINGNEITPKYTDENGYYYFEDMVKGNYKVYIGIDEAGYEITTKEVGANREINSKFNSDGYTDVITTLDSIESPIISENYMNFGISPEKKNIAITKVAEEDDSQTLEGSEFVLYKYIGNDLSIWNNQSIDTSNVDASEWELVGTYTTKEDGIFKFEDLQVIHEYRLVEIKAPEGRLLPAGQWRIEFIYGDYDENDNSLIKIDDKILRITAVGNPPALKLNKTFLQKISTSLLNTTKGELLLPNSNLYTLPSSGGIGITTLYKMAIIVIALGIIIIISIKRINIVNSTKSTKKGKNKKIHKRNYRIFKL